MAWTHNPKPPKGMINDAGKGPASGKPRRKAFEPGNKVAAAENRTGATTYRRLLKEERIGWLEDRASILIETTKQDSVQGNMIQYLMNREMGTPTAKQEITGKDGAPLQSIGITTVDPIEAARVYQQMVNGK